MSKKPHIQMPTIFGMHEPKVQPLKRGNATSWLGDYEWVSLPITEENKYDDSRNSPAFHWCIEQYGDEGHRWFYKEDKFYFRNDSDLMMFILRWS